MNRFYVTFVTFVTFVTLVPFASLQADPCSGASDLTENSVAKCDGILMPSEWAARSLTCLEYNLPSCRNELNLKAASLTICNDHHTAFRSQCDKTIEELTVVARSAIGTAEHVPFYKTNLFWGLAGLTIGLGSGFIFLK